MFKVRPSNKNQTQEDPAADPAGKIFLESITLANFELLYRRDPGSTDSRLK